MNDKVERLGKFLGLTETQRTELQVLATRLSGSNTVQFTAAQISSAEGSLSLLQLLEDTGLITVSAQFPQRQWDFSVLKKLLSYLTAHGIIS